MIRWVGQEDQYGCGPACLAMVLGLEYSEAKRLFLERFYPGHSFHNDGVHPVLLDVLLADHGYAVMRRWKSETDPHWHRPFAPVHVVTVYRATGCHFEVMLADGSVLDPASPPEPGKTKRLTGVNVRDVAGVFKVM